jgi:excisionase family DNA binding protein
VIIIPTVSGGIMETLLNIHELENVTSIKVSTLRKFVMLKKIPYVKIGRLVRFLPSEIERWLRDASHHVAVEEPSAKTSRDDGQLLFDAEEK